MTDPAKRERASALVALALALVRATPRRACTAGRGRRRSRCVWLGGEPPEQSPPGKTMSSPGELDSYNAASGRSLGRDMLKPCPDRPQTVRRWQGFNNAPGSTGTSTGLICSASLGTARYRWGGASRSCETARRHYGCMSGAMDVAAPPMNSLEGAAARMASKRLQRPWPTGRGRACRWSAGPPVAYATSGCCMAA